MHSPAQTPALSATATTAPKPSASAVSTTSTRHRFENLSSIRGVAALLIAIYHFPVIFAGADLPALRNAFVATNLFLALSGFLMMAAYSEKLQGWSAYGSFAKARVKRLVPLHILSTAMILSAPFVVYGAQVGLSALLEGRYFGDMPPVSLPVEHLLAQAFLLQGFGMLPELVLNFPAWSMGVLLYCALLFGAICVALPRRFWGWAFGALALVGFWLIATQSTNRMGSTHDFGFARGMVHFFVGALVHLAWQSLHETAFWKRLSGWADTHHAVSIGLAILFATTVVAHSLTSLLLPLVLALLLLSLSQDTGDLRGFLGGRVFDWLAQRSYAIFMTHASLLGIGGIAQHWIERWQLTHGQALALGTGAFLAYLALVLVVADWAHRKVEARWK